MLVDQRRSRRSRVTVLGTFTASLHGEAAVWGADTRRAVAYLAVHRRPQHPADLAADLWPGIPVADALPLLRDALAEPVAAGVVVGPDAGVVVGPAPALDPAVTVDLDEAMALVRTLTATSGSPDGVPADLPAATALLRRDLLPGESAAWLVVERERFRQLRLNALEELSAALSVAGRHGEAVALADDTVRSSPSRESARRALIEAHLAQGEIAEAVAQYDEYQELLRSSVGAYASDGTFGLEALLPPVPAWPVLRVRRSMQRVGMSPPGVRVTRNAARRLVSGGSAPGTVR